MTVCPHCVAGLLVALPALGLLCVNGWCSLRWRRHAQDQRELNRSLGGVPLCPEEPQGEAEA